MLCSCMASEAFRRFSSGSMLMRGEDIISPTETLAGSNSRAIILFTKSFSVTIPVGCPALSTIRNPLPDSLRVLAASVTDTVDQHCSVYSTQ